jgi:hypothetical protein
MLRRSGSIPNHDVWDRFESDTIHRTTYDVLIISGEDIVYKSYAKYVCICIYVYIYRVNMYIHTYIYTHSEILHMCDIFLCVFPC